MQHCSEQDEAKMSDETCICVVNGAHGQYVPQVVAQLLADSGAELWHIKPEDHAILLEGPENEAYLDTWNDVLSKAYKVTADGHKWSFWQDGDVFVVRDDHVMDC